MNLVSLTVSASGGPEGAAGLCAADPDPEDALGAAVHVRRAHHRTQRAPPQRRLGLQQRRLRRTGQEMISLFLAIKRIF